MHSFMFHDSLRDPSQQRDMPGTRQGLDDHRWILGHCEAATRPRETTSVLGEPTLSHVVVTSWFSYLCDPRAAFIPSGRACSDGICRPHVPLSIRRHGWGMHPDCTDYSGRAQGASIVLQKSACARISRGRTERRPFTFEEYERFSP